LPRRDLGNVRGDLGVSQKVGGSTMSILAKFRSRQGGTSMNWGLFLVVANFGNSQFSLSVLLQPAKVAQQPMHLGTRYSVFNHYSWPREEQQITVDAALPFAFLRLHS